MQRSATTGRAIALLTAGVVGWVSTAALAQPAPRPEQQRAPVAPAPPMPDPNALKTPPPPAIGAAPSVPSPTALPAPIPRATTAAPTAPPAFPPPETTPPAPAPVGDGLRILFAKSAAALPADATRGVDALAARMAATAAGRVQITAYAGDPNAREARRLSLARAEAVRSRLVEKGVRSDRINLRPLGDPGADGPADRADILIVN